LEKIKLENGLKYKDLIEEIEKKIKEKNNIDDKIQIIIIRYKIFELFTDNSFGENKMLEREKEYKKIFNENNKKYNKKDIIEILLKSNYNDLENLKEEIEILNLDEKNIKEYLQLLDYLHKMYKDEKNIDKEKIKEYYKKICRTMCENAIIKISNSNKDMINEKKSEILSSLLYYNNHSIENLIDINKSGINCLL
jgi:hypothetical protein